jgi:hypothetical protein
MVFPKGKKKEEHLGVPPFTLPDSDGFGKPDYLIVS